MATATSWIRPPRLRAQCRPRNPSTSSAGSLTAEAHTIRNAPPSRCGSSAREPARSPISIPARISPIISASLWMPLIRWNRTSGLPTPSHSASPTSTPQRRASRGSVQMMSARPDERQHAVGEDAEDDVVAGERRDAAPDDEEERAVRGGRVAPDRGDGAHQRVVDAQAAGRPEHVGVDAPGELGALRQVAVDVAGEQRRGDRERQRPRGRGARQLGDRGRGCGGAVGAQHLGHPQPRQHHQDDARVGDGDGQGDVAAGQADQPEPEQRVGDRQRARAEAAHRHQQGGDEAEPTRAPARIGCPRREQRRRRAVELRCHHAPQRSDRARQPRDEPLVALAA